jgi:hypothetical protein
MAKVLVAIVHKLTEIQSEQLSEMGEIFFLKEKNPDLFEKLGNCPDNRDELRNLASQLVQICADFDLVLFPIGSPAFAAEFVEIFGAQKLLFAHTVRKSVEVPKPDGTVHKTSVFEHQKFI